jgi:hypothetical protein
MCVRVVGGFLSIEWVLVVYWATAFLLACGAGFIESSRLNKLERIIKRYGLPGCDFLVIKNGVLDHCYGHFKGSRSTLRAVIDAYEEKL